MGDASCPKITTTTEYFEYDCNWATGSKIRTFKTYPHNFCGFEAFGIKILNEKTFTMTSADGATIHFNAFTEVSDSTNPAGN